MSLPIDTDLTLPLIPEAARRNSGPVPLAAYVPITVAIIGVAIILVGGIKAPNQSAMPLATAPTMVVSPVAGIDTIVTGAIKTSDARHEIDLTPRL